MQRRDDAADLRARERVVDRLRIAPCGHDLFGAQLGEMLGERRLAQPNPLLQRRNGQLALMELAKHHEAVAIGDGLQERFGPSSLCRESF